MEFEYDKLLQEAMAKLSKDVKEKKRFQIPTAIIETQGNKTLIKNFGELISVLRRDGKHVSKFLFKELATPGSVQGNILTLQRKVSGQLIQDKITAYVKEFIYCKECSEPDTQLMKKDRLYFLKCDACGCRYPVRAI